ncbi:DUF5685 family protein [Kitasatospora sp. NPDC096147]|uniref:DUF5685 family protein n=1 Tax=Kitasatospora sp. NPDC096147 TaxID=3364093 RepID=UPI0038248F45
MFGIIRPCRHSLSESLRTEWLAHLCGLCLALRDDHGQLARTATNYDGLVISVLVEAQSTAGPDRRQAGPCPLRGMRGASVAKGEGARLAAAVSLALASVKVKDHVLDRDGAFARRPVAGAAGVVARRWGRQSGQTGESVGFDTAVLTRAAERQGELERSAGLGSPVLLVTEPTETATAEAVAHTAVLAGRPGNAAALYEVGRLFGRLAHLLDAAEDQEEDARVGAWNPLTATGTDRAEAERLCRDAVHGIELALKDVEFTTPALPHRLLVHETRRAADRVFRPAAHSHARGQSYPHSPPQAPGQPPQAPEPPRRNRWLPAACAMWTFMACTGQLLCCEHEDPFTGRRKEGACANADCGSCDPSGCGECFKCCGSDSEGDGGGGCGDGCDCCGCDGCCCDCGA